MLVKVVFGECVGKAMRGASPKLLSTALSINLAKDRADLDREVHTVRIEHLGTMWHADFL